MASFGGWLGLAGLGGFAAIVLALHTVQAEFDPRRQLISELAAGPFGWTMLPAFSCLAASLVGVGLGLGAVGASPTCRALLTAGAVTMLAAGAFPLGRAAVPHVAAVAVGFTLIGLSAYLLPARPGRLRSRALRPVSWLLGVGAVLSLALANCGVPHGIAQRLAVACVLGWLCVLSWMLVRCEMSGCETA